MTKSSTEEIIASLYLIVALILIAISKQFGNEDLSDFGVVIGAFSTIRFFRASIMMWIGH